VSFLSNHVEGHFSFFTLNTSQYDADSSQYDDDTSQYDTDTSQYDADTSQCDVVLNSLEQAQYEIPHCVRNDGFPGDIKGKSAVAAKPPLHFFPLSLIDHRHSDRNEVKRVICRFLLPA